ncbi:MAG: carboxypeptidase-like regulatory domain-containing protein [Candidatus Ozemobacteraceae bacterium]
MQHLRKSAGRGRWLLFTILALASIAITGCEKGSLGVKDGALQGIVLDASKNNVPIADAYVTARSEANITRETLTGGDGVYSISVPSGEHTWAISVTKIGYATYGVEDASGAVILPKDLIVGNGETVQVPLIRLAKTGETVRGSLRGYPIDVITGVPLQTFTITQIEPARYKTFDTAQEFKENGWGGLEGGNHQYKITCENYVDYLTAGSGEAATDEKPAVTITASPYNLGIIRMTPLSVSVQGTLRNLPGYVLSAWGDAKCVIWAESAGKVVATATLLSDTPSTGGGTGAQGNVVYILAGVPSTVGNIAVKCKLRGYDLITINPSVSIPKQRPSGTIAGIDANFANIDPLRRDLRVIMTGTKPQLTAVPPEYSSIEDGEIIRTYIRQGGKDIVPYVDAVGHNYIAEAYFTGVITGYKLDIFGINQQVGYCYGDEPDLTIPENGNSVFTVQVKIGKNG